MLDDLVLSPDVPVQCYLSITTLDDLNAKYVALIRRLNDTFQKNKKSYPVRKMITGLCTADKGNLTFFATDECFRLAKTIDYDDVFHHIGKDCKYFDFTILKTFIDGSNCTEAKQLMDNYIIEIENTVITDLNLNEYDHSQTEDTAKKLEIICDLKKLNVKELTLIVETVQKCLKLPSGSISVKDVKKNCIILVCRIPENVKYYLLQLKISIHELTHLFALKIQSLIIDDEIELKIPLDCNTKVCTYVYNYNERILYVYVVIIIFCIFSSNICTYVAM